MSSRICSSSAGLQASPSNPCHTFGVRGLVTSTAAASASDGGGTARQLQALSERLDAAEQKLVVLEAKEGIRQAVHQFAQFLDAARQKPQDVITRDSIGALFTASASIDLKQYGSVEDLDSIQPFLQRYASKLVYSKNHVANLTVDVSKEKPTSGLARFYLLSAGTLAQGRESVWALETLLVKMQKGFDEKWRIRSLEYEPGALLTPYAGPGWDTAPNILQELLEREQKQ